MKKLIVFKETGKKLDFEELNLPMLIHGAAHAGASLFSVTVAVNYFLRGSKVLFFTTYPMAKEEFLEQISGTGKEKDVFYLERAEDVGTASAYSAIIVKSGDSVLCLQAINAIPDVGERIVFVKNIESILTKELFHEVKKHKKVILSGDIDGVAFFRDILQLQFQTKIVFSKPSADIGIAIPQLEKYVGLLSGRESGFLTLQDFKQA